jgi:hypothetical protein
MTDNTARLAVAKAYLRRVESAKAPTAKGMAAGNQASIAISDLNL